MGIRASVFLATFLAFAATAAVAQARPAVPPASTGLRPPAAVKVAILMYHVIDVPQPATPNQNLWVDPSEFQAEVTWLAGRGYQAVTLQEWWDAWHGGPPLPARPVIISLDDGFRGWYTNAFPILQAAGFIGSMQLALSHLGRLQSAPAGGLSPYAWKIQPYMVRAMVAAGWELDSHSLTHPMLSMVPPAQLHAEVYDSRTALRARFGVPVNFFCYPYGDYSAPVIDAVKGAGYLGAVSVDPGLASSAQNPYVLRRIGVDRGEGVAGIRAAFRSYGLPVT
jgi:peptidoglycan/xylan/chitin deacetylase (PgdA/CDA1 family)